LKHNKGGKAFGGRKRFCVPRCGGREVPSTEGRGGGKSVCIEGKLKP